MRKKYRMGVLWEFVLWNKPADVDGAEWSQFGCWSSSMTEALERHIGVPYAKWKDQLREVAPWFWSVRTNSQFDHFTNYVCIRRDDCPNPEYMPLDPPPETIATIKRLPTLV